MGCEAVQGPAPVMRACVAARTRAEERIRKSGLPVTLLRRWYVLGPGHRWPHPLRPLYWVAERLPGSRDTAVRLGLVTWEQMLEALTFAVERPCDGVRVLGVPQIRSAAV